MPKLRVLDLFSGIGGFSLGLERAGLPGAHYDGFETVAFCEIEELPRRVLAKHWPDVLCYDDVRQLSGERLSADGIAVDVICGGFPCQDISIAGKGLGLAGERSGLFAEVARLVGELRPAFVVLENVAELFGRGLGDVLGALAALGYDAEWDCIPAAVIGAPHIRERAWILAYPDKGRWRTDLAAGNNAYRDHAIGCEADCILGAIPLPSSQWYLADPDVAYDYSERRWQYYSSSIAVPPEHTGLTGEIGHDGWETPWPQFLADVCRVDDGIRGGLDKAGFQALGNAVVPQIPELIGNAILHALHSTLTPTDAPVRAPAGSLPRPAGGLSTPFHSSEVSDG